MEVLHFLVTLNFWLGAVVGVFAAPLVHKLVAKLKTKKQKKEPPLWGLLYVHIYLKRYK